MPAYNPKLIEQKWQRLWEKSGLYTTDIANATKPFYNLMMFPYPSGEGLHVGHAYAFSGADVYGRFQKMLGNEVFEPMGFDAFGIHSENYAIKVGKHPAELIEHTTAHYEEQLRKLGNMYDWSHKLSTTDPNYYKWTQWLFLQLYKHGLAERKEADVNWCPSCKTVLADEQVITGRCERCDTETTRKKLKQWFLKITKYQERLLANLDHIDWSEKVKAAQRNWIGKSEGATIHFAVNMPSAGNAEAQKPTTISVFTTRPDTLFGATYLVLAPEHPLAQQIAQSNTDVAAYIAKALKKTEQQRIAEAGAKTGVDTGVTATHPATNKLIPIWVSDYVLSGYGAGAIMAVPAHDERVLAFAQTCKLPVVEVVTANDTLVNSGQFDGLSTREAQKKIISWLEQNNHGTATTTYRLRDWLISRQRYWGPPIPMIYCDSCGEVPVPEHELPVLLPRLDDFQPKGKGLSPLATVDSFVHVSCPKCGADALRETDVSDTFLDSAWYFLRYPSSDCVDKAFDPKITKRWLPVHMYIGGAEHSVLHLLYSRFITMALKDMGHITFDEPFTTFRAHGLLIKDGSKMSKSKGNVVNPDEYIDTIGADSFRIYLQFLGPFEQGGDFRDDGVQGAIRFLNRLWNIVHKTHRAAKMKDSPDVQAVLHRAIKKVTEDIGTLKYNTAIATIMGFVNSLDADKGGDAILSIDQARLTVQLIAPFAPHITEELWALLHDYDGRSWKKEQSIFNARWPQYNPEFIVETTHTLVVQINGKVRDTIEVTTGLSNDELQKRAFASLKIQTCLQGKLTKKVIVVQGKLVNIVV